MTDQKPKAAPLKSQPVVTGSELAPVVYFDGVVASGAKDGIAQIELAMNQIVPTEITKPDLKVKVVITGHLRCSPTAARELYECLRRLLMADEQATPDKSKQN